MATPTRFSCAYGFLKLHISGAVISHVPHVNCPSRSGGATSIKPETRAQVPLSTGKTPFFRNEKIIGAFLALQAKEPRGSWYLFQTEQRHTKPELVFIRGSYKSARRKRLEMMGGNLCLCVLHMAFFVNDNWNLMQNAIFVAHLLLMLQIFDAKNTNDIGYSCAW